jgi:hypothetical protein
MLVTLCRTLQRAAPAPVRDQNWTWRTRGQASRPPEYARHRSSQATRTVPSNQPTY